jgi:hypothetical protein
MTLSWMISWMTRHSRPRSFIKILKVARHGSLPEQLYK